jgi:hypothetical protein
MVAFPTCFLQVGPIMSWLPRGGFFAIVFYMAGKAFANRVAFSLIVEAGDEHFP